MITLRRLPLLTIVFLLFSLVFVSPITTFAQESYLPEPTGPYTIGTTTRHWIDEARPERYARRDRSRSEFRELMVQIWYPGDIPPNVRMTPVSYFPYPEAQVQLFNDLWTIAEIGYTMPQEFASAPTHAYLDIPVAEAQARYPVLIFSPGLIAPISMYQTQFEELASHGYIVIGITHSYTTPGTVFPDGTTLAATAVFDIASSVWSDDQRFVLNQLEAIHTDVTDALFAGRLDLENVGVYGHSWGGEAADITMSRDERFSAGINVDGTSYVESTEGNPKITFINDYFEPDDVLTRQFETEVYQYGLRFTGFRHSTFSDCPLWVGVEVVRHPGVRCVVDNPLRAIEVTNAFIRGFFDQHLKGEVVPFLEGPSDEYPEVVFISADD